MSYALKPFIGPINRPPPWRRRGFHSFQGIGSYVEAPGFHYEYATAGLGAGDETSVTKSVRELQQILLSKGFSVGSSGADNVWGTNTRNALEAALGRDASSVAPAARANSITMPTSWWFALAALPDRPVSGGGSSSRGTSSSQGGGITIGPSLDPESGSAEGSGIQWGTLWPWVAGAGAFVALGGVFLYMGRRKRAASPATPAPMTANRRRRARRRQRGRGL